MTIQLRQYVSETDAWEPLEVRDDAEADAMIAAGEANGVRIERVVADKPKRSRKRKDADSLEQYNADTFGPERREAFEGAKLNLQVLFAEGKTPDAGALKDAGYDPKELDIALADYQREQAELERREAAMAARDAEMDPDMPPRKSRKGKTRPDAVDTDMQKEPTVPTEQPTDPIAALPAPADAEPQPKPAPLGKLERLSAIYASDQTRHVIDVAYARSGGKTACGEIVSAKGGWTTQRAAHARKCAECATFLAAEDPDAAAAIGKAEPPPQAVGRPLDPDKLFRKYNHVIASYLPGFATTHLAKYAVPPADADDVDRLRTKCGRGPGLRKTTDTFRRLDEPAAVTCYACRRIVGVVNPQMPDAPRDADELRLTPDEFEALKADGKLRPSMRSALQENDRRDHAYAYRLRLMRESVAYQRAVDDHVLKVVFGSVKQAMALRATPAAT